MFYVVLIVLSANCETENGIGKFNHTMTRIATPRQMIKAVIQNRDSFFLYGFDYKRIVNALLHRRMIHIEWEEIGLKTDERGLPEGKYTD